MGIWLNELRRNLPGDVVLHVVGTKADMVARDPSKREVPFERCIAYVAENLAPGLGSTPPPTATPSGMPPLIPSLADSSVAASRQHSTFSAANTLTGGHGSHSTGQTPATSGPPAMVSTTDAVHPRSPSSKRSSGFWGQEVGWDACHEISAESGEGVEEVFRVVTRKLVEQNRKMQQALLVATATPGTPGYENGMDGGYFDGVGGVHGNPRGSFRVGRDRRSWLFSPGFSPAVTVDQAGAAAGATGDPREEMDGGGRKKKCC